MASKHPTSFVKKGNTPANRFTQNALHMLHYICYHSSCTAISKQMNRLCHCFLGRSCQTKFFLNSGQTIIFWAKQQSTPMLLKTVNANVAHKLLLHGWNFLKINRGNFLKFIFIAMATQLRVNEVPPNRVIE